MPTRVAPVGAQWQGAEAPVYARMSDSRRGSAAAQPSAGSVGTPAAVWPGLLGSGSSVLGRVAGYAGGSGAHVVGAVGAGGWAALLERRLLARSHPAGGDQEGAVL